jgi:hypothetical protein
MPKPHARTPMSDGEVPPCLDRFEHDWVYRIANDDALCVRCRLVAPARVMVPLKPSKGDGEA